MPDTAVQDSGSARAAVWVAAIGNTILALPGSLGLLFFLAVAVEGVSGSETPWSLARFVEHGAVLVAVLGPILLGFYLAFGYWKAGMGRQPASSPRRFWWMSAAYNCVGAAIWAAIFLSDWGGASTMQFAGVAWTGSMLVLSVTEARRAAST